MFQFYVGDLFEVFPKLLKYYANTPVEGNCRASYIGLKVFMSGVHTFNVSIHFDCELSAKKEKFVDFGVGIEFEV